MSLIKVFLPDFKRFVRNTSFAGGEGASTELSLHPVSYYDFEPRDARPIVAFYNPVGSFIYCVEINKTDLPPQTTIQSLIADFNAIELTFPLYHYHIEQHGRIFM